MEGQIISERKKGLSYSDISKKLNIKKSKVGYYCRKNNLGDIGLKSNPKLDVNPELADIIKSLYFDLRVRGDEVSEILKIDKSLVTSVIKNSNLKRVGVDYSEGTYQMVKNRRKLLKLMGVVLLGGGCHVCGYEENIHALDFHHINPEEKSFTISRKNNTSWCNIKKELEKCIVLCRVCHASQHHNDSKRYNEMLIKINKYKRHCS